LDGISDAYTVESVQFTAYDAAATSHVPTGDRFDYEGKTGTFVP
jgi:hypothetical protein